MNKYTLLRRGRLSLQESFGKLLQLAPAAKGLGLLASLLALLLFCTAAARSRKARSHSSIYTVTATAYEAVVGQTDSKPFITADNSRIPRGYGSHTHWLALSRDLLRPWGGPFEFGDKVRVRGVSPRLDGTYTVHDTMHRRYRHRLDLLVHPREHIALYQPGAKLELVSYRPTSDTKIELVSRKSRTQRRAPAKKANAAAKKRLATKAKKTKARANRPTPPHPTEKPRRKKPVKTTARDERRKPLQINKKKATRGRAANAAPAKQAKRRRH